MRRKIVIAAVIWVFTRIVLGFELSDAGVCQDVQLYYNYAESFADGQLPYADFKLEYPPGALLFFLVPGVAANTELGFNQMFIFTSIILEGMTLAVIAYILRLMGKEKELASGILAGVVIYGLQSYYGYMRFDLLPAFLTVVALLGCVQGRRWLSWMAIGGGFAVKLYPIALAPLVFLYWWHENRGQVSCFLREVGWALLFAGGTVACLWGPFWWLVGSDFWSFISYHSQRGLQVESLYANVLALLKPVIETGTEFKFGAWHLKGVVATEVAGVSMLVMAFVFLILYALLYFAAKKWTREEFAVRLPGLFLVFIITFLLTGKVLSPQYIMWVTPFIIITGAVYCSKRTFWGSGIVICAATIMVYPLLYLALIRQNALGIAALTVRNLVLILLFYQSVRKGLLNSPARKSMEI